MSYTEEEIKKYLNIEYRNTESFSSYSGYNMCNECGTLNGHILGQFDVKDFDRLYYRKKSIYHRKYYYDKKVKNISKLINLTDEQKFELYNRLLKIDNYIMKILNNQYFRKRMININYLIKKIWRKWDVKSIKLLNLKLVLKF